MEEVDGLGDWLLEDEDAEHFDMYELGDSISHLAWTSPCTLAVCLRREDERIGHELLHVGLPSAVVSDPDPEAALTLDERDIEILQGGYPSGRVTSTAYLPSSEDGHEERGWLAAGTVSSASPSSSPVAKICFWPLQTGGGHGHHHHGSAGEDFSAIRETLVWAPETGEVAAFELAVLGQRGSRLAYAGSNGGTEPQIGVLELNGSGAGAPVCVWRGEGALSHNGSPLHAVALASGDADYELFVAGYDGTLLQFDLRSGSAPTLRASLLPEGCTGSPALSSFATQGHIAALTLEGDGQVLFVDRRRIASGEHTANVMAAADVGGGVAEHEQAPSERVPAHSNLAVRFSPTHPGHLSVAGLGSRGGLVRVYDTSRVWSEPMRLCHTHRAHDVEGDRVTAHLWHDATSPGLLVSADAIGGLHVWKWQDAGRQ